MHVVAASCRGEQCSMCQEDAAHTVIAHDDPNPIRHTLTAYLCCRDFSVLMGVDCGGITHAPCVMPPSE